MDTPTFPPFGFEALTVSNSVKQLTTAKHTIVTAPQVPRTAKLAYITVEGFSIRWTTDGTAPVAATTGHVQAKDTGFWVYGYGNIKGLKMIRNEGSDATIQVSYFG